MITPLPDGWAWHSTHVVHSSTFYDNPASDKSSTTIQVTFRIHEGTLPKLLPYPTAPLKFATNIIDAKWTATGNVDDPALISISLAGPAQVRDGSSSRLNRRGAYTAFRNEIELVRSGAPAAELSTLPPAVVHALDAWAASEGNLPVAVVQ